MCIYLSILRGCGGFGLEAAGDGHNPVGSVLLLDPDRTHTNNQGVSQCFRFVYRHPPLHNSILFCARVQRILAKRGKYTLIANVKNYSHWLRNP